MDSPYLILFFVTLGNVAVRAFQQINVTHGYYARVPFTSMVFAFFDMLTIGYTATVFIDGGSWLFMWMALGSAGAIGCLASMYLNKRLRDRYASR
jgi:hypothetical protein